MREWALGQNRREPYVRDRTAYLSIANITVGCRDFAFGADANIGQRLYLGSAGHEGTAWPQSLTNNRFAPRQENRELVVLDRGAIQTDRPVGPGPTEKPLVMIWADPGCSVLPLTTGNWSITIQTGRTTMGSWLSEREQRLVAGAEAASAATPVPTQIVSNGEYLPPSQSATQKKVEARINELADLNAKRLGLNRRQFMRTSCGMAAAFLALNEIYGNGFQVPAARAPGPQNMLAPGAKSAGPVVLHVQDPLRA